MKAKLYCGSCGAVLNVGDDSAERDAALWVLITRFAGAHEKCGYVLATPEPDKTKGITLDRKTLQ